MRICARYSIIVSEASVSADCRPAGGNNPLSDAIERHRALPAYEKLRKAEATLGQPWTKRGSNEKKTKLLGRYARDESLLLLSLPTFFRPLRALGSLDRLVSA